MRLHEALLDCLIVSWDMNDDHSFVLQYNTQTNVWSSFCKLKIRRQNFASDIIEGKLVITGGMDCTFPVLGLKRPSNDITEVLNLTTKLSYIAGNLNTPRQNHGMSVMKIGTTFKLVAFGGESMEGDGLLDSSEVWNSQTESWESSISKLEDKVSRFSSLTVYNNSRSACLINIPLPQDEPKPFSSIDTDYKYTRAERMAFAPPIIWLMVCFFSRLFPEGLWTTLKFVAWYEMIVHSSCMSFSKFIGVKNSQNVISSLLNQLLNLFHHPVVVLPRIFGHHIRQFVTTFTQIDVDVLPVLRLLFAFFGLTVLFSRYIFSLLFNIVLDKMYHETLQVILFLSFEKMYSALMTLKQLSKKYSFLPQLARIISDPIVALVIIAILMNSEPSLEIVVFTLFYFYGVITIYYMEYDKEGAKMFCLTIIMFALLIFLLVFTVVNIDYHFDRNRESKAVVLYYNIPNDMCMALQLTV